MTLLFTSKLFLDHKTGRHPESPERLSAIEAQLQREGLLSRCTMGHPEDVARGLLASVHTREQIERVEKTAGLQGWLDGDTPTSPDSFHVALQAAGSAQAAVDGVVGGKHKNALCLIRPPGHHATDEQSMGFCIFNNVAVAARHAMTAHGLSRVLIVDFDVHHGNGTQDIFYEDDAVTFMSIHRFPFYPGSGDATETGTGNGIGHTINVPVAFGTSREKYLEMFRAGLERAAAKSRPELIVVSAGFDAHGRDPVGSLGLESADFAAMTRDVMNVADTYSNGRVVSCLEGGYHLEALGESASLHLKELLSI